MSGAHLLRSYVDLDSPVHRLAAGTKLLASFAVVTAIALLPRSQAAWSLLALVPVACAARWARIPGSAFIARVALVQLFVLGMALLALFQPGGLRAFLAIAAKSTASVATLQLLAHTTRFDDLTRALRRAHVPELLLLVVALLHRYLFIVIDESRRMRRARAARTWSRATRVEWRSLASVVAVSFVRSVDRAERIARAMRARGAA